MIVIGCILYIYAIHMDLVTVAFYFMGNIRCVSCGISIGICLLLITMSCF